ncbi:hypothetical protein OG864_00545 [Streptomyces sp. NBC_00124]|uniref:hypothetical protein n=1 Tax=Streptomyces sp. NBC_00124 TaxID=2975662 RepID=UPI002250C151|nr:hypothetical protein [Streptomyces sp. NBC_00124]MCX5357273.1 hypothetical protein [Streptomyces sp. NBC_00124]
MLAPDEIKALYRRAFGTEARPLSAVELGMGMFNSTLQGRAGWPGQTGDPAVAPEPAGRPSCGAADAMETALDHDVADPPRASRDKLAFAVVELPSMTSSMEGAGGRG